MNALFIYNTKKDGEKKRHQFDATPWIDQAASHKLAALGMCMDDDEDPLPDGYVGGDEVSDEILKFCRKLDKELDKLWKKAATRECYVQLTALVNENKKRHWKPESV